MKRVVLGLVVFSSFVFGHGINLNLEKKGEFINVQSNYGKNKPCIECRLVVLDDDKVLLETKLDKQGNYDYKIESSKKLTFKVNDKYGHLIKKEFVSK